MTTLRVILDGEPLDTTESVAFWKRFSAWMDEHPGDLGGFAKSESLASVRPEMHDGAPVLVGSRTAAQTPYTSAPKVRGPGGGSRPVHAGGKSKGNGGSKSGDRGGKRGR